MNLSPKRMVIGFFACLLTTVACAGMNQTLNPDPVHGGACHNGNQLSVSCTSVYFPGKTWCCPMENTCGNGLNECIPPDPPVFTAKKADAGLARDSGL